MLLYGLSLSLLWIILYGLQANLRYERSLIFQGELWRLFTAHLVHLNLTHLVLNLVGWWLFLKLCGHLLKLKQLSCYILILALGISLLLLIFQPHLQWYLGFSGVLYGLLLIGSIQLSLQPERGLGLALISLISLKFAWDSYNSLMHGSSLSSAQLIGAPVVLAAHGYGLLIGVILSLPAVYKNFK
jgi:rhomboid family GlyGly-CTERM serine protease